MWAVCADIVAMQLSEAGLLMSNAVIPDMQRPFKRCSVISEKPL